MGILRRAIRNITRRKTRSLLVIIVLSLALAMLTSIPPGIIANQQATQKIIDEIMVGVEHQNAEINMVATQIDCSLPYAFRTDAGPYHNETVLEKPPMNVTDYSNLTQISHVAVVIPILKKVQREIAESTYTVYGIPLDAAFVDNYSSILPSNITAGRNLQAGDSGVVVLQEQAAKLFDVGVNDTINVLGQNFKVVGIHGYDVYNITAIYMSLGEAQTITNTTGQATALRVFVDSAENVATVESVITTAYPELDVDTAKSIIDSAIETRELFTEQIEQTQAAFNQVQSTALMEMGIIIVADCVIIFFLMLYTVRERTREIGTLKAMGASNKAILGQFMLEGTLLSLIAGIVGIAIGIVVATALGYLLLPHLNLVGADLIMDNGHLISAPIAVTVTPELILLSLGVAVLLGALGSLYPAWRAARTRPAEAMRYE